MSLTWGEITNISSGFLASLEQSQNPEEDLKKENIVSAFLAAVPEQYRQELQEESIYEDILCFSADVAGEYKHLKHSFDDLTAAIDTQKQTFLSRKITSPKTKEEEAENKKINWYISQLEEIRKDVSAVNLVQMAIRNSRLPASWGLWGVRHDFLHELFRVNTMDADRRKYINFGELAISEIRNIPDKQRDHERYMMYFGRMIADLQVLERIQETVKGNPLMSERFHIVSEALKYFRLNDFQMFLHIIVPQMEGFFRIYMNALHNHQETRSISDIVRKIRDRRDFWEYIYFAYDFPVLRNAIAHGEVPDVTRERAYEILMDLHWVIGQIDSDELDYKNGYCGSGSLRHRRTR